MLIGTLQGIYLEKYVIKDMQLVSMETECSLLVWITAEEGHAKLCKETIEVVMVM